MPCCDELRGRAEEAVAALDVGVEEGQGLAGLERLEPEADLAQLDRHRVDVDGVEAVADDVAQGRADGLGGRLLVAGADLRQALGDAVGGGDQEVAGAAAGSTTESSRMARSSASFVVALAMASSRTGSRAESRSTLMSEDGV